MPYGKRRPRSAVLAMLMRDFSKPQLSNEMDHYVDRDLPKMELRHLYGPFHDINEREMINHILSISNPEFTLISQMRRPFTLIPHSFSSRPDLQVSKPSSIAVTVSE